MTGNLVMFHQSCSVACVVWSGSSVWLLRRRNALVALDLIVTVIAAGLTLIAAVAGICGMNLAPLPVQDSNVRLLIFASHHL